MSEQDRAAKAARAKAMFKKHQQQKKAAGGSTPDSSQLGSPPPSRTFSPAPTDSSFPTTVDEEKRDVSDFFDSRPNKVDSNDWLSSLPRAKSPKDSASPLVTSPIIAGSFGRDEPNGHIPNSDDSIHRILTLESENATLLKRLTVLELVKDELSGLETLVKEQRTEKDALNGRLVSLDLDWNSKFSQERAANDQLKHRVETLQSEKASFSKQLMEIDTLRKKLKDSDSQLTTELSLVSRLKTQLSKLTSEVSAQSQELQHMSQIEQHLSKTTSSLEAAKNQNSLLQQEFQNFQLETDKALENERQTISLLVSEKSAMNEELNRLHLAEDKLREMTQSLEEERQTTFSLTAENRDHHRWGDEMTQILHTTKAELKDVSEKSREHERQLHLSAATITDLKESASRHESRVHELEEHIQKDDRAEQLEETLRNTQDRADELEFQLSKVKQNQSSLKSERDQFETQVKAEHDSGEELKAELAALKEQHTSSQTQITKLQAEKEKLAQENAQLSEAHAETTSSSDKASAALKIAMTGLQAQLSQSQGETASQTQQLALTQSEVKNANRRADEAERVQKELQTEGSMLLSSLNEMRPKIVELTESKLELTESLEELEVIIGRHEMVTRQLEASLEQCKEENIMLTAKHEALVGDRDKDHHVAQQDTAQLQTAYQVLRDELDTALATTRRLEGERQVTHQEAHRRMEDIEKLVVASQAQEEELMMLREQVNEDQTVQDEEKEFLERSQDEIEALRQELVAKDEEIERLETAPRSLDDEMLSGLRQKHAIDLSNAQSTIRALETSVFDAEAQSHHLQKQVHILEEKVAGRSPGSGLGTHSPAPSSRPSSRNQSQRPGSTRPSSKLATIPPVIDQNMSPATWHKRKMSLAMLKARMDSELSTQPPISPVPHLDGHFHTSHRPQFFDESTIFWCHCCEGDLVQFSSRAMALYEHLGYIITNESEIRENCFWDSPLPPPWIGNIKDLELEAFVD